MSLNSKALEAAVEAYRSATGMTVETNGIAAAIRAYLSLIPVDWRPIPANHRFERPMLVSWFSVRRRRIFPHVSAAAAGQSLRDFQTAYAVAEMPLAAPLPQTEFRR